MKKSKNKFFHPAIFIPLLLVFFIGTVVLAKVLLWPAIKLRQAEDLKQSALEHLEKENYRNAFADIQKSILKNPEDIESFEIALEASEKSKEHHRYVPAYLSKLMEIDPDNAVHFQKFILFALRLGAPVDAKEVFEKYPASLRDTIEYHQFGYSIGSGLNDDDMAERHLSKLVELNPDNDSLKLFLSTLQLRSSEDEGSRDAAQSSLENFAANEESKVPALRVLLTHAMVENNTAQIEEYIADFDQIENLPLIDELLKLQARKVLDESSFPQLVDDFLSRPVENSINLRLVIEFLLKNDMADTAAQWVQTLPADLKTLPEVARKISQIYFKLQDWDNLESVLVDGDWGKEEYGRLLLLALIGRQRDDLLAFQNHWKECIVQVGTDRNALKSLFQTVKTWGWTEESVEVLEIRFREEPEDDEVFQILTSYFMSQGATDKTLQTLERRVEFSPDDSNSKNNLALLSLLTGANVSTAFNYAQENFKKDSENPFFVTTWALALALRDRADEALIHLGSLNSDQMDDPQRAVYMARIFLAAGNIPKAENYLAKVDSDKLLGEEKQLLRSIEEIISESKG